jgi:hypothetical protein
MVGAGGHHDDKTNAAGIAADLVMTDRNTAASQSFRQNVESLKD